MRSDRRCPESQRPRQKNAPSDLLKAALRHRPDRIIVGEIRGPEARVFLDALNIDHRGSLSTIHATALEMLCGVWRSLACAARVADFFAGCRGGVQKIHRPDRPCSESGWLAAHFGNSHVQ
ncbi:MAG: ATPase, T2SS/T4P/T4SS family [Edaphobacter sp.]